MWLINNQYHIKLGTCRDDNSNKATLNENPSFFLSEIALRTVITSIVIASAKTREIISDKNRTIKWS